MSEKNITELPVSDLEKAQSDVEKAEGFESSHEAASVDSEGNPIIPKSRGVLHIEAVKDSMNHVDKGTLVTVLFAGSILFTAFVAALDSSTTYSYSPYATSSFNRHSMLSTLSIATSIMTAICKPFLAKISDLTSRPLTYIIVVTLYTVGYIIVACSPTIAAYVVGASFVAVGSSGLDLLNNLVAADLTPLKWRGMTAGILASPSIITTWIAGYIVEDIVAENWRWGYGMFAIIMPVIISPAICLMLYLDRKAIKQGKISLHAYGQVRTIRAESWFVTIKNALIEIDAFGLLMLGFGFSLLLLPFSLEAYANGGWKNPSMIAMMVLGGVILIAFFGYECYLAPSPCMPRRIVFNRTFAMSVAIDSVYMFAGYIYLLYFSSYTYVCTNWTVRNWTYFNNTLTMGLCVFGIVAGIYQRITHRYKYMQIFGLVIKIIAYGILIKTGITPPNTALFVCAQIIIGAGGGLSVVASSVAAQASVPHQDLSLSISLLSLWSNLFAAVGSAVASAVWTSKMPVFLREEMPSSINDTQVYAFFEDITTIDAYAWGSEIRMSAVAAYVRVMYYMMSIALGLTFIPLLCACFQTNFYLGDAQNAVEGKAEQLQHNDGEAIDENNWKDKVARFFHNK